MASMSYDSTTLHLLMDLIDSHKDELSVSDYIKVCNILQAVNTNLTEIFPLQNVKLYTNKSHAKNIQNSIKLKNNELTCVKNIIDAHEKKIKEMEKELKDIEPCSEKKIHTFAKKIKLESNIDKLKNDNVVFKDSMNDLSSEITYMRNEWTYYKQLRPDQVCESGDKMYEEYIDEDLRLKSEMCIRNANNVLLNSFSKIYTRINALDWIDNPNSYFECYLLNAEMKVLAMVKEIRKIQREFVGFNPRGTGRFDDEYELNGHTTYN